MGVLGAAGLTGNDVPDNEPEAPEAAEPEAALEKSGPENFVPQSALEPKKPSRRQAATEAAVEAKLAEFRDTWTKNQQTYEQRLAEQREEMARMRGELEATRRMPQQAPAPQAQEEDPRELRRQARELLDAGKYDQYEEMSHRAAVIAARRETAKDFDAKLEEVKRSIPQQVDPQLQFLISQHRNVALNGQRGMQAVMLKDQELGLYGVPPGPGRVQKAFELADKMLQSGQQQHSSTDVATALSAVPTARPAASNGGGEPGVTLTPLQEDTRRAAKMSREEYVKWANPQKYFGK